MNSTAFWTRKYRQNIGKMIGVCYRYVLNREIAEDLAHDAFLKAIEEADHLRGLGRFDAWLMRITTNTALHYLRDNNCWEKNNVSAEVLENIPDVPDEISEEDMMETIRKADFTQEEIVEAVGQLPEHHRVVFNLYVFDHFTHKQIAEQLGISENTSKSHLARARKKLQQILFNKTQNRKRQMMALLLILPKLGKSAIDQWCQHQMAGFAIQPVASLSTAHLATAAGNVKLLSSIGLRTVSITLAIGTTTAAVGTMVAVELHKPTASPSEKSPQTSFVQQDTLSTDVDTIPTEIMVPVQTGSNATQRPSEFLTKETTVSDSVSDAPQIPAPPVVVKKVIRKKNMTVVVKDTNSKR